jgi:hypothetical protein
LQEALTTNEEISALAASPLMFSVLVLTYHEKSVPTLPQQREDLERQVWDQYVTRMLTEKGTTHPGNGDPLQKCYPAQQTRSWLRWMARQMRAHDQMWFTGEALEENWLPTVPSRVEQWVLTVLPAMLLGAATMLLLTLVLFESNTVFGFDPLPQGILGSFFGWYISQRGREGNGSSSRGGRTQPFVRLLPAFLPGLLLAGSFGVYLLPSPYTVQDWLRNGIIEGSIIGSCGWFLQRKRDCSPAYAVPSVSLRRPGWSRFTTWRGRGSVRQAMWMGIVFGIGYALSFGLSSGLSFWFLSFLLHGQAMNRQIAERVRWRWRTLIQWSHLRRSLLIASGLCCFFGLHNGLSYGLIVGNTTAARQPHVFWRRGE